MPLYVTTERVDLLDYLELIYFLYCYGTYANIIAPDLTPQNAASHLGLFCLLT